MRREKEKARGHLIATVAVVREKDSTNRTDGDEA